MSSSDRDRMREIVRDMEALLFALGEALPRADLAETLGISADALDEALALARSLQEEGGRGVALVEDGTHIELRAAPESAQLIERARKESYSRDIGRAGLEVLAAILYRGAQTRAKIDFIRGVNSSQTLRTLAMRGLLRKIPNPKDERSFLYEPTTELLSQLGVSRADDLPEFSKIQDKLRTLEEAQNVAREPGASADANTPQVEEDETFEE